jgi:hypothetical protein
MILVEAHEGSGHLSGLLVLRREPVGEELPAPQAGHDVLAAEH